MKTLPRPVGTSLEPMGTPWELMGSPLRPRGSPWEPHGNTMQKTSGKEHAHQAKHTRTNHIKRNVVNHTSAIEITMQIEKKRNHNVKK